MAFLRIVSDNTKQPTVIEQINLYAKEHGLVKKAGAYYDKNGKFIGSIYQIGKIAGIDMMEWK